MTMQDWYEMMSYGGLSYLAGAQSATVDTETIENSFTGYINSLYKSNGIVFALMEARRSVFSEARFQFQRIRNGRPGDLFGSPALGLLEHPWPNCTTGELLSRAIQDVDLSGNHYVVREPGRLRRLRPDWVQIVLTAPPDTAVQSDIAGYAYWPGGIHNGEPKLYFPEEIAHWCPIPDPDAQYRGMSWLTPVLREIQADKEATIHKGKFYANAATPKLAVSLKENVTKAQFMEFMDAFEAANGGVENAYKTIYLGGGADVNMVGANMVQMDFKNVQGAGETRIASAAGVPPVVVGFSEGMQGSSLNSGNYKSAKESFGDRTMRPLWRSVSAAYQSIIPMPSGSNARLWYDDRDIAFLRTDRLEAARIQTERMSNLVKVITAGFTPESSVAAVNADDLTMLEHSGLVSVQLLPPGQAEPADSAAPADPALPPGGKMKEIDVGKGAPAGQQNSRRRWLLVDTYRYAIEERHGSLGEPGYFKLHPGNAGKGLRQHPMGGMLGSSDYSEQEHLAALSTYVSNDGSGYQAINDWQRKRELPDGSDQDQVERDIDTLADLVNIQEPLDEEVVTYRGARDIPGLGVGDEFHDQSFSSSSDDEGIAGAFAMQYKLREGQPGITMEIHMPPGTKAWRSAQLTRPWTTNPSGSCHRVA
jgi:phage portal protein BeeE